MTRGIPQLAGFGQNGRLRWRRILLLYSSLFLLVLQQTPSSVQAQNQTAAYWSHSASSRISHIINQDLNQDGVDEFIVASENGRIELLNSVGNVLWSYAAGDIVQALTVLNMDEDPELEIGINILDKSLVINFN